MFARNWIQFLLLLTLIFFLIFTVSVADDGPDEENESAGPKLETRCARRYRKMMMMNGNGNGNGQPNPATEAALASALTSNVCADYDPTAFFPYFSLGYYRALGRCKAAAQYLFMSNIKRPDDCQRFYGVRCGQDPQGNPVCLIKTLVDFFMYDEKPLAYCAQFFQPTIPNQNQNNQNQNQNNQNQNPNNQNQNQNNQNQNNPNQNNPNQPFIGPLPRPPTPADEKNQNNQNNFSPAIPYPLNPQNPQGPVPVFADNNGTNNPQPTPNNPVSPDGKPPIPFPISPTRSIRSAVGFDPTTEYDPEILRQNQFRAN